ncbi:hypothetical protein Dimus_011380, partial [Dionaea muscipula]
MIRNSIPPKSLLKIDFGQPEHFREESKIDQLPSSKSCADPSGIEEDEARLCIQRSQ